jgi:hypothetical protein
MTKSDIWLLDVNAPIAFLRRDHVHRRPMQLWFNAIPSRRWSSCPITQAGFVRIMTATGDVDPVVARRHLEAGLLQPNHEFWPAGIPYPDAIKDLREPKGHRQVTDAYLLGLALHKTYFDEGVEPIPT